MRARTLVALGLMTFGLAAAPAASAAVGGGAGVAAPAARQQAARKGRGRRAPNRADRRRPRPIAGGGAAYGYVPAADPRPTVPGDRAVFRDGIAYAPAAAPLPVQEAVWAANELLGKPYVYGGGHGSFIARGYDCSGAVSYVLHRAGLLDAPLDSTRLLAWGARGRGTWITVYTNPRHAFVVIAGLRFDTSGPGERGPRWRPGRYATRGFKARRPASL